MKKQKHRPALVNIWYLLRQAVRQDRTYPLALAAVLAVKLALPVIATLLPTAAVAASWRPSSSACTTSPRA